MTTSSQPKAGLRPDHNYAVRSFRHNKVELVGEGKGDKISHKLTIEDIF